tara:strand:+ start:1632 stop:2543 length:912 start_codon:yes stop_codon:yes gene_type:complete
MLNDVLTNYKPVLIETNDIIEIQKVASSPELRNATIIAVGSGTILDVAKVITSINNTKLIAIPSILSSNVFATNKSVILKEGTVKTIQSKIPDKIIIDIDLIKRAKPRYNWSGIADVLSIFTALYDWKLAMKENGEQDHKLARNLAESLLSTIHQTYPEILNLSDVGIKSLAECLVFSGYVTNLYGSGRPESGSEHMFSRAIEESLDFNKKILHGESVMLGILLTSELQGQNNDLIYDIANKMKLKSILRDLSLTEDKIVDYLLKASTIRRERFSIFNMVEVDRPKAVEMVERVMSRLENGTL